MTSPNTTATRQQAFQLQWLQEIGTTIETLINDPTHKYLTILRPLLSQDLKIIRRHVFSENEERLRKAEERVQVLNN